MAAKHRQTTSSTSLDEKENERPTELSALSKPNGDVGMAANTLLTTTGLSPKLDESYQLIKQQQQKYNELSARLEDRERQVAKDEGEWQQVCSAKNKLKRKKKLSTSLTSMSDAVNQEKRTRIEGIQLNCRGKLRPSDTNAFVANTSQPKAKAPTTERIIKTASHTGRPPVPPKSERTGGITATNVTPPPAPPRLKRKLQENVQTIQKLNALADQLRLEINELKTNLISERGAVRTLRAQNESENRKWKNEVKKLQHTLDLIKKSQTTQAKRLTEATPEAATTQPATAAAGSHVVNYEIQRLTSELNLLKEANKALEEKKVINCDADRRKAADMRTLRDTYEIRLTQLKKSAKIEITRLLEEIKTKERNIGQLKKDLQILQNSKKINNKESSKNATTKNQTTNNKSNKKPKKTTKEIETPNKDEKNSAQAELEIKSKDVNQAQVTDEMTQLKDIELIRNTRNIHRSTTESNQTKSPNNMLPSLDINTTTTTSDKIIMKEYHSLPHDISDCCLLQKTSTETQTRDRQHEFRPKDSNSDSDSALSSAPPSISPQPPPAGLDSVDIWQTIRTYTQDIEKLQKEIELLHSENVRLQAELNVAKEEILNAEKCALEAASNVKFSELNGKIKELEEREHHLQSEANELREQNELLEFRILELEESNDKWSLQSHTLPSSPPSTEASTTNTSMATAKDVWSCNKEMDDPMLIFGNNSLTMDSGITSPHIVDEDLLAESHESLCRRLRQLLMKCNGLDAADKLCLQQLLNYLQQLDLNVMRSGPESLNANSSGEEPSSLDLVKSRVSDYSSGSASSTPGARLVVDENCLYNNKSVKPVSGTVSASNNCRIVATVQPYNSCVPTNTPTDSPRKSNRLAWQSNSLSESGVFVESDFLGDSVPNTAKHAHTQTEFEDDTTVFQRLQQHQQQQRGYCKGFFGSANPPLPDVNELLKRLQYYKDRLDLVERKVLVYESSGDIQAKHLADRLQREIHLEQQLKELLSRVELLENENSALEEEKCEFEEAENDTRLRLQRLEVELEILAQRNVELELSKEALSAKYKDCRAESQILQDDLSACETRICNLVEDKRLTKQQLETLRKSLPLILMFKLLSSVAPMLQAPSKQSESDETESLSRHAAGYCPNQCGTSSTYEKFRANNNNTLYQRSDGSDGISCEERELSYLKEEIKNLRSQIKELNSRHYEAMETADSHWVDLEREYKEREEAYRCKEVCLKQKIAKLQDCLRDDARAANEKIQQLEEAEQGLKTCLVRISKDHRELLEEHNCILKELECYKEQKEQMKDQQKPLVEALESERRRSKNLIDELTFVGKLQQNSEDQFKKEADELRKQIFDMRKEYLHIEVTNGELKEEVSTLEAKITELQIVVKDHVERERVLQDELRTKEELYVQLEQKCNERENNYSLAQELYDSPSKRFRKDQIKDLKTASRGLGHALRNLERCELELPTHMQFHSVARDVKKLADSLLNEDGEEVSDTSNPKDEVNLKEEVNKTEEAAPEIEMPRLSNRSAGGGGASSTTDNIMARQTKREPPAVNTQSFPEDHNLTLTVGMALMPQLPIDLSGLPSCSSQIYKQICEVPSELRKISSKTQTEGNKTNALKRKKRTCKRFLYKRLCRSRMRHIALAFSTKCEDSFYDASDIDLYQSEVLQKRYSFTSFHSVPSIHSTHLVTPVDTLKLMQAVFLDKPQVGTFSLHAFSQTETLSSASKAVEAMPQMCDKETDIEMLTCSVDCCVQVDDLNVESRMDLISEATLRFIAALQASVKQPNWDCAAFRRDFIKIWESNKEFRQNLEILKEIWQSNFDASQLDAYEKFVAVIGCVEALKGITKPVKLPLLSLVEDKINESLLAYHNRKVEAEFYCTIYYPVDRPLAIKLYSSAKADSDRYIGNLKPSDDERPATSRHANQPPQSTSNERTKPLESRTRSNYPNSKQSQTAESFLRDKAIREGRFVENAELSDNDDEKHSTNIKPSQTDASYLQVKAANKEGGGGGSATMKSEPTSDDAITKKSQTEMSYLQSKKLGEKSDVNVQTKLDEHDREEPHSQSSKRESPGSLNMKPTTMHYPTNFRIRPSRTPVTKSRKVCACRTGQEKTDSTSENETSREVLCKCTRIDTVKSNTTEYDEEKSSQFSELEGTCVRPTGEDKPQKQRSPADRDVLVLSEKDIKMRGGFRTSDNDSWCGKSSQGQSSQSSRSKVCRSTSETDLFMSCESSSETSFSKVCPSACSGISRKAKTASKVTCYCSVDHLDMETSGRYSTTSASRPTDDIVCSGSHVSRPTSAERCTRCGKKQSTPNVRSTVAERCDVCGKKSKQSVRIAPDLPCDICSKKKSKLSVKSGAETPCGICGKQRRDSSRDTCDESEGDDSVICARPDKRSQDSEQTTEHMLSCCCSTESLTCFDNPDAPCQTPQMRQDRIVELLENLNDVERCASGPITEERAEMVQQLFKEITFYLCREPQKGDDSNENQISPRNQRLAKNRKQAQLQCCLSKMQDYIEECFLKGYCKPTDQLTNMELYRIELDPDYVYKEGDCRGGNDMPSPAKNFDDDCGCESEMLKTSENVEEEECEPCKLLQQQLQQLEEPEECDPCKQLQQQMEDFDGACEEYKPPCPNLCDCCHCRAMRCRDECKTVATTLQGAMIDPTTEMKYFIDAMIIDLDTMEKVLHTKDCLPKPEKPVGRTNRAMDSFPVKIMDVNDLGMSSLYVQWEIYDCCGIAGYEIYVDGQLTNRFYSPGHESGVICDVNINKMHQIVLRAQPVGEDFPGDSCTCTTVATNRPSLSSGPGSSRPWVPSIYLYHPNLKVVC